MQKRYKISWAFFVFILFVTWVIWPMLLYRDYVFGKAFYSGWVTIWKFFAPFAVIMHPVYEGRWQIYRAFVGIWGVYSLPA